MLIKLARPQKDTDLLTLAREMREHGRNAIWVASDLLRGEKSMTSVRRDRSSTRSGCTRAPRRGSCTPRAGSRRTSASRAAAAKWTARASWDCCCSRRRRAASITITADGPDEADARSPRSARWSSAASTRRHAPDRTRRLARHRHRQGARAQARHARPAVPHPGSAASRASCERLDEARARSREQIEHIKQRIAAVGRRRARLPLRRAAADARRRDAVDRAATIIRASGSTPSRRCSARSTRSPRCSTRRDDRYLRERKGDVADVVGRLCMNLRAGGDPAGSVQATSKGRWCSSPTS